MTGGYISLSGKKNLSLNDKLQFILFEYKLKYNAYLINKNRKQIINIDIFITKEQQLILILTDDLIILERKIKQILNTNNFQISYRNPL